MIRKYIVEMNEEQHGLQNSNRTKHRGNYAIGISTSNLVEVSREEKCAATAKDAKKVVKQRKELLPKTGAS